VVLLKYQICLGMSSVGTHEVIVVREISYNYKRKSELVRVDYVKVYRKINLLIFLPRFSRGAVCANITLKLLFRVA